MESNKQLCKDSCIINKINNASLEKRKLVTFKEALSRLVHIDKTSGLEDVTDFSYLIYSFSKKSNKMASFIDYLHANPDVAYCLSVVTGDKIRAEYPSSEIPKGNNEIYPEDADNTTPPMTHEELLERVNTSIKAMV